MPAIGRGGREIPVHRLRPNDTVWTPPSVIFLDTETRWVEQGDDELHRLRLWTACHVDRRQVRKRAGPVTWGWGHTPREVAEWITERSSGRDCLWLYAHNLGFDLTTTNLAETMGALGWKVSEFSVTGRAPFLRLTRAKKVLTVVDSWSWLPTSLESLATLQGRHKMELPALDASDDDWVRRCAVDVDLLARSVLGLMDWWDAERLGRWTISGAACGWNAMRHTPTDVRHVIDPEPELVAQDRDAVRGGRKDASVVRSAVGGPWVELDLEAAYPTVARELPLPVKRGWAFKGLPLDTQWIESRFYGAIAECVISTDRPRYPVRHGGVTWYPLGTFKTVLAGPELAWARESGHLVSIGPGQAHRLGFALRPWATWVLDPSKGGTVEVPAVGRLAAKSWGRSVLGKFAARSHTTTAFEGTAPFGWSVTDSWDARHGRRATEVTMGGEAFYVTADAEPENSYPAVLAWVESEVRVRLGKVLEALDGSWWTADTDGMLVDLSAPIQWAMLGIVKVKDLPRDPIGLAQALANQLAPLTAPLKLRPKRSFESLAVLGPMHMVAGDVRKISGVQSAAVETAPWQFVNRDWPGLKWQLEHSAAGVYTRPRRVSTFREPTTHRWVLSDGGTVPVTFTLDECGENRLLPWSETSGREAGAELAETQYRLLRTLT